MAYPVHFVGSVGLDTVDDVFATIGSMLGSNLRSIPDGEPGGRRHWILWQYPVLASNPYLRNDAPVEQVSAFPAVSLAPDVAPEDVRFGELGYAREARTSYVDFLKARSAGLIAPSIRFQVSLPTPTAVVVVYCAREAVPVILPAYERAMLREVETICAAIPHEDLLIQWDVCMEMLMWDGGWARMPATPDLEDRLTAAFGRLGGAVPTDVGLGFHLCYGDHKGKHFIEPRDTERLASMAGLLLRAVPRPISYIHMPVPAGRTDDAYFAPLRDLALPAETELFLGLVHASDGISGTKARMQAARQYVGRFGISTECGIARTRTKEVVLDYLRVYAEASKG